MRFDVRSARFRFSRPRVRRAGVHDGFAFVQRERRGELELALRRDASEAPRLGERRSSLRATLGRRVRRGRPQASQAREEGAQGGEEGGEKGRASARKRRSARGNAPSASARTAGEARPRPHAPGDSDAIPEIAGGTRRAKRGQTRRGSRQSRRRASVRAKAAAEAETAAAETAAAEAAAAVADAAPPVPGFGAAMTLEQYRALAAAKPHMKGTFHATPQEEKDAAEDKAKKGWWPCQSYRCTRGSGANHMNPKYAEKCQQCGAMKPLGAGSEVFHNNISDEQYLKNQSRRVGK